MTNEEIKQRVLYNTVDPTVIFPTSKGPGDMPAMTTLLHYVCNNDASKFEEATRLVELFIDKTMQVYEEDLIK